MSAYKIIALALVLVIGMTVMLPSACQSADLLGAALKLFGIAYVVDRFGGDINKFINKLANQRGVKWEGTTKVVPIFSVGRGSYIGAAQVVGPPDRVSSVRGVGQVEASIGSFRGRYLVPIKTKKASGSLKRVNGVGVSALIDFRL